MKTIIFCSTPIFLWIFKKFNVYIRSSFPTNKNSISVRDDIFSASDYRYCDHLASCIESELIERILRAHDVAFLTKWGGKTYTQYFIGGSVIEHARNVYESFNYASKVKSKYNIKGGVYIFPLNFSLRVYEEMERMELIPRNIRIHFFAKIYIKLHNIIKFMYYFIRMLAYPEIIALKAKNQNNFKKYSYKSCSYLDDGLLGTVSNNNKIFSLFDNQETLYIDDRFRKFQLWPDQVRKIGMHVLRLENVVKEISTIKYIKQFYKSAFKWRYCMVRLAVKYPFLIKNCSRATRERILWEIFYDKFYIENAVRMMVKENLTSSIVHKKNNVKTIFTYFSTTEEIVDERITRNKSACHDYTHMISDYVVSSNISNKWLKTHENKIGKYIPLGPIFSDLVRQYSERRYEISCIMKIPDNVKIISFLDHSFGHRGVLTVDAFNLFIETVLSLSESYNDIFFLFKSKKSLAQIAANSGNKSIELIEKIRLNNNSIYVNDYGIDSLKLIGISDLVVSAPLSSVFFESLCGGVKTISYDPLGQYKQYDTVSLQLENMSAINYNELEKLITYWLTSEADQNFSHYLAGHVYLHLGGGCNGSSIKQFRNFLETA